MREDQYLELKQLGEQLIDVALDELNPNNWSGAGRKLSELSRDDRGDRYWSKKNAGQTLTIIIKMQSLTGMIERAGFSDVARDPVVDNEIDDRNAYIRKEAERILERFRARRDAPKH